MISGGVHRYRSKMGMNLWVLFFAIFGLTENVFCDDSKGHFTDTWAVTIPGGIEKAKDIVRMYGFTYVDKVRNKNF